MAKKKLSRDQKRKLKKRKMQQQKKQRAIKREEKEKQYMANASEQMRLQETRIMQVFGVDDEEDIPAADESTVQIYGDYLKTHLQLPCLLTGIESIGYFGWEERFEFGYGTQTEYARLRKERGALADQFLLENFEVNIKPDMYGNAPDIWVIVKRTDDGKRFEIPLSELKTVAQNSDNQRLLNDYTVWHVNW